MASNSAARFAEEVQNFLAFAGAEPPPPNSIFILVMGMTGTGKSTFISQCSGKEVKIGHDLQSSTTKLSIISFRHRHRDNKMYTIYLIDTPGFDDTNRSDIEVLSHMAHYLCVSYSNRIHLSGIVFLHRISDNRMSGTSRRNITMFHKLVGELAFENVAVATTMWKPEELDINISRERQLLAEDFRGVVDGGGRMFRLDCSFAIGEGEGVINVDVEEEKNNKARKPSMDILEHLIDQARSGPVTLRIQTEMVDERKKLEDTAAGQVLMGEMATANRELEAQLADIREEVARALQKQDTEIVDALQSLQQELATNNRQNIRSQESLKRTLQEMYLEEEKRLARVMEDMELQWALELSIKEQELKKAETLFDTARKEAEDTRRRQQGKQAQQMQQNHQGQQQLPEQSRPKHGETRELQQLKSIQKELLQLRQDIEVRQKATGEVKKGFKRSLLGSLGSGLLSGAASAAIPAIVAGTMCCMM